MGVHPYVYCWGNGVGVLGKQVAKSLNLSTTKPLHMLIQHTG